MKVGVVSRSFPQLSNDEAAKLIAENGFAWTELCFSQTDSNYWVYNGRSDLSTLTEEKSRSIVDTYRRHGVEVTSIGVFTNLLEPDDAELEKNLAYFDTLMGIAAANKVPFAATECGFIPGQRGVRAEAYETAFQRLLESVKWLCARAEAHQVDLAIEPCVLDVLPSAKRTADFINQVGSSRLKVLLDPANLIANSSEDDMFNYLKDHIAYFHGKDRKVNDAYGRIVGDGDINWHRFLQLYHQHTEDVPFILEYVNIDNFCFVRDRVLQADASA